MSQLSTPEVTLDAVLRLVLPLSTATVGSDYSGRPANWVTILTELSELNNQVQAGDIVILPANLQAGANLKALKQLLTGLSELSASALLTFRPIADNIASEAENSGIPILIVTGDVTLREVHQGIAGLLVDRQKQIQERGMQLYRRLTEMSREEQGLAAMTEVMSRLTGKIVAVQDKRLDIMAMTIPSNMSLDSLMVQSALIRRDILPRALKNRKAAASALQNQWQQMVSVGDTQMGRLISPIISGDRARGYVSVVGLPEELDLLDTLTVEYGAAACALEMAKAKAISEAKKELRGNFLEGLLAGTLPETEINRLSGRLDHDTTRPHAIMTFAWDGDDTPSLRRLESPLSWLVSSHNRSALTHIYSNNHVCVFQSLADRDDKMSSAVELARHIREHLRAEFPKQRLLCGLSGPAKSLGEWPEVYHQALQAMKVAERLHLDKTAEFNNLGVYRLLTELVDAPTVQEFCSEIIGPLVRYDQRHRSNLVKTIGAYFENHGNISQTAENLFVHRNTLLYRLERIQDLTGQHLDNSDERLALQLALKLRQIQPDEQQG
jgi:purine catabolism regulator